MKTMPCPKCDNASGFIRAYSGIANGVCFTCKGSGVVKFRKSPPPKPATEYQIRCATWILKATDEQLAACNYNQLNAARNFAHGCPIPGFETLLEVWRAKGDAYFFAAQEKRLEEFYAERMATCGY